MNRRTNRIVGLSTLVCLEDSNECYDVGLVSTTGRVNGLPKSRLAGIIGTSSNETVDVIAANDNKIKKVDPIIIPVVPPKSSKI